jgi:hypothetical protein
MSAKTASTRISLAPAPGVTCGGGIINTGTTPQNVAGGM